MELSDKSDCFARARPECPFLGLAKTKLAVTITYNNKENLTLAATDNLLQYRACMSIVFHLRYEQCMPSVSHYHSICEMGTASE